MRGLAPGRSPLLINGPLFSKVALQGFRPAWRSLRRLLFSAARRCGLVDMKLGVFECDSNFIQDLFDSGDWNCLNVFSVTRKVVFYMRLRWGYQFAFYVDE